ncbi:MAG: ADP-forming succinate--CoA ligase subunit beta [Methanobacteriaceae archaeon]|jgi:succinyl-CoA synthetase beta subunit|nr:ADP-forming succinate--CoA ligase subunit beta [Methanobacteriaceae archaeon]
MKFFEYNGKKIFEKEKIAILEGYLANSPEEAKEITSKMDKSVVLKSQVLVGGRGKAGGIKFADTPDEAFKKSIELFGMEIKGETVEHLLIEEKADIKNEFFISVTVDRNNKKPVIMASSEGGVDIENLAISSPEKLIKYHPNPLDEFLPYEAREIARKMQVPNELISKLGTIIWKLFNIFNKYDATTAEINPLILTDEGLIAADAKLEVENDSLFRHKDLVKMNNYKEKELDFVKLDGNIAVIGNGAGLTLTGMDMIKLNGGKPATFLDIGGGSSQDTIEKALNMVLDYEPVKVIFLNVLGGITRADDVAKGVIDVLNKTPKKVNIVIRLTGTNEKEGQELLEKAGIPFDISMEKAAKKAVEICKSLE